MILIDLQKFFDKTNPEILLGKLHVIGFSEKTIAWFKSYLSDRAIKVKINNHFSDLSNISCGVPQGSILGPILFLPYVNDMPQAVHSDLFLYADDSGLTFQHKDVHTIEHQLNKDVASLCEWFVDNKLSIHLGEEKTKCILFGSNLKLKKAGKLNIMYKGIETKQYSKVTYLGCLLDKAMPGESMALKTIKEIDQKLKFLYRKNRFLTPELRRLLCNDIIQPHFDYACSAWYPNLTQKLKKKFQVMQNKCICFYLQLDKMSTISHKEFKDLNWLPVINRFEQCVISIVFKFINGNCPHYLNEVFEFAPEGNISLRNNFLKLKRPFRNTNTGQKALSFIGPSFWNQIPETLKKTDKLNTFKHNLKKHFFNQMN